MEKALESAISSNASVRGVLCADTSGFTVAGISIAHYFLTNYLIFQFFLLILIILITIDFWYLLLLNNIENGDLVGASAGRYVSIAKSASCIAHDAPNPTILIETENRNIVVKDYDAMVIVLSINTSDQ